MTVRCFWIVFIFSSERNAALTIRGTLETKRTGVHCATTLLAADVPNTWDSGAVLALAEGRTSTTRLELDCGVDTFVIADGTPGDRARV